MKDFPRREVPTGIEVLRPVEFAEPIVAVGPAAANRAVAELAARSGRHGRSFSVEQVLDALVQRYGMHAAVSHLR